MSEADRTTPTVAPNIDTAQSGPSLSGDEFSTGETAESRAFHRLASDLRAGARAIQAAQPGTSDLEAQASALRESNGLPGIDLGSLEAPDTEASEHLIWFAPKSGSVVKATAYGRFGHDFDRRRGGGLPADYLDRMALSVEILGDSVSLLGKFDGADGSVGLVIRQNYIPASRETPNPSPDQIAAFFQARGFEPVPGKEGRHLHRQLGVEIDDTHAANFILTEDGTVVPVDLLIRRFPERRMAGSEVRKGFSEALRRRSLL